MAELVGREQSDSLGSATGNWIREVAAMKFKFVIATGKPEGTRLPIHDFLDSVKHDNIEV